MQPKFDQNKKKMKSLLSILDTMEWSKKPSLATVPLKAVLRIRTTDFRIRILLFSSAADQKPTKNKFFPEFFCLLLFEGTFTSVFTDKKSKVTKYYKSRFFLLFLLVDGRTPIRTK
jgi:hypothetical protein